MSTSDSRTLTERLGHFAAGISLADIPAEVIARAEISLVHNIAVALAGRHRETVAHRLAKLHWPLPAEATLLFDGARVNKEAAAFANGALMHARSQDDTHAASTSHPGAPVMAAALAMAEAQSRSGADLLVAIVAGYEILGRIGRDFDEQTSRRGFRAAAVFGAFGGAAAAARLMNLSGEQITHALGLAANFAGGLSQVWLEGSAEYPLQLGFAARNGLLAALAAASGATAARHALEGAGGFFRAYADAAQPATEILEGLGQRWQLAEVTVKPYPVCAILQGPVGLAVELARGASLSPADVASVELKLSPYEAGYAGIDNPGPFASTTATKMSAQFSLAAGVLEKRLALDDLARLADPAIAALADKVRVVADAAIAPRQSRLRIALADGRNLNARVDVPVGQPSRAEIESFAHDMATEAGIARGAMDDLLHAIATLQHAATLDDFTRAIGNCAPRA